MLEGPPFCAPPVPRDPRQREAGPVRHVHPDRTKWDWTARSVAQAPLPAMGLLSVEYADPERTLPGDLESVPSVPQESTIRTTGAWRVFPATLAITP